MCADLGSYNELSSFLQHTEHNYLLTPSFCPSDVFHELCDFVRNVIFWIIISFLRQEDFSVHKSKQTCLFDWINSCLCIYRGDYSWKLGIVHIVGRENIK